MSAFDTADSLFMTRVYSWSYRDPQRRLHFNTATTGATVLLGFAVAAIYLCALLSAVPALEWLAPIGGVADNFEFLGYAVVALFALTWLGAWFLTRRRPQTSPRH
jgi:high-affinity nickel-transport protein